MWGIENPFKVFSYIFVRDFDFDFNFMAVINERKWNTLNRTDELEQLIDKTEGSTLGKVEIKNPDNPVQTNNAYIITYRI